MVGFNRYEAADIIASDVPQPENPPENVNDDNLGTRWASSGADKWITIDLGEVKPVDAVALALWYSDGRNYDYVIEVSQDGQTYETVATSSGKFPEDYKVIQLPSQKSVRYVRYRGNGSDVNEWNSVLELGALVRK